MASAKDKLGNDLKEGDIVHFKIMGDGCSIWVMGNIVKVSEGGIVVPGGQRLKSGERPVEHVTAGSVKVLVEFDQMFDPRTGVIAEMVKAINPSKEEPKLVH